MGESESQAPAQPLNRSNPVAFGALSADALSSTAYGPEQIMIELLPAAGLAAFALLLPIIGVVVLILAFVAVSYRQVATAYPRAGGAYVLARENFGLPVAQVAAAAVVINSVTTVAVQSAAGTVAIASAIPALGPYRLEISIGLVLILWLANLLGRGKAGLPVALPTYLFVGMISLTIVVGLARQFLWGLPRYNPHHIYGAVPVHQGGGLVMGATVLVVLRAFANGSSSLTGIEAISHSGNVFRQPQGINARRVLTLTACILGFFLVGVGWLAHVTHAVPLIDEYPSMLSEIARAVFGHGLIGNVLYLLVQVATAAILFTGASAGFNGFRALADVIGKEQPSGKRAQLLMLATALLAMFAAILLFLTAGSVSALLPLYAIPVFIGFSITGYAMTKHHLTHRERGWSRGLVINLCTGILSSIVVMIFVVAKFTEGAWLVVLVFPLLVVALILINRSNNTPPPERFPSG